jgi:hypothetical protein
MCLLLTILFDLLLTGLDKMAASAGPPGQKLPSKTHCCFPRFQIASEREIAENI